MKISKRFPKGLLIIVVLFLGLLAACDFPTPTPTPTESCIPDPFGVPDLISPANFEVVSSLTPTLSWTYSSVDGCDPSGFAVWLDTENTFSPPTYGGDQDFPTMSWSPGSPLNPATEYWWRVTAKTDRPPPAQPILGPHSSSRRFFTGPICAPPDFGIPSLVWPMDGEVINTVMPGLDWEWPSIGCLPAGYRIDLSTDPSFADTSLSGGTGNPSTKWFPGDDLLDCMEYHWRVAPITGTTLGDFSETWSFSIDVSGICEPQAEINGIVWHDLCATPHETIPLGDPLPLGCIRIDDSIVADGIYDPSEPGIEGVTLRLGSGACPSSGLATDTTDVNGVYTFTGLSAGDYCVTVDALTDGNDLVLIPGGWTYPDRGNNPQEVSISLLASQTESDVNFGWDYQFLPAPEVPASLPIKINFNADSYAIDEGDCTTLRWEVENATDVFLDGKQVNALDAQHVCPTKTTTYTMLVTSPEGEKEALVTIEVEELPEPPQAPGQLRLVDWICNEKIFEIQLQWVDQADNEKGYKVYRDGSQLTKLAADSTRYTEKPPFGGPYTYEVSAYNEGGSSARVSVQVKPCSP
ncbi:MAG: hypothetical protein GTO14_18940 [Anaerolineales bacterium]|nr:hypothetical protein [Anaerolineales bacterium]